MMHAPLGRDRFSLTRERFCRLDNLPEKDRDLFIEKLFKKSQMRELELDGSGLSDEWAKLFARRVLPIMPQLERLV